MYVRALFHCLGLSVCASGSGFPLVCFYLCLSVSLCVGRFLSLRASLCRPFPVSLCTIGDVCPVCQTRISFFYGCLPYKVGPQLKHTLMCKIRLLPFADTSFGAYVSHLHTAVYPSSYTFLHRGPSCLRAK